MGEIMKKGATSKKGNSNTLQVFNDKLQFLLISCLASLGFAINLTDSIHH